MKEESRSAEVQLHYTTVGSLPLIPGRGGGEKIKFRKE